MTVYLCGGINGLSDAQCKDWREVAKSLLQCDTLDPMRRDYRGREDESASEIVAGDLEDIKASAFVLVNATRPSWGTAMEIVYAKTMNPPEGQFARCVVAFTGGARVSPWLRTHCSAIVATVEEACDYINTAARYEASMKGGK